MGLHLSAIQEAYRRSARFYDLFFGTLLNPGRKTAVQLSDCHSGNRILEVGVGTGLSLPYYPDDVKVVGIDLSPEMLEKARELNKEKNFRSVEGLYLMNAEKMEFKDNSFDCVVAMYIASVVPNPKKVFDEIRRVCRRDGKIIVLNHFSDHSIWNSRTSRFLKPFSEYFGFRVDLTLKEFLKDTGLSVTNRISINLFDWWTILIAENKK